jgi:hypothetical protein
VDFGSEIYRIGRRGKHRPFRLARCLEGQRGADREERDAEDARPVERDPVAPEQAPAVDLGAHGELARDQDPHRRRHADARAGVRDREDDDQAHHAAEQHPPRLVDGSLEAGDAVAGEDEDHERDSGGQDGRERQRLEHADPLAETRHEGDLDRSREAGGHRQRRRQHVAGHSRTLPPPSDRRVAGHRLVARELRLEHALAARQAGQLAAKLLDA